MLRELLSRYIFTVLPLFTPKGLNVLNLFLFNNFPLDTTELRNINQIFKSALHEIPEIPSSIRHYDKRITYTYKTAHSEITIIRKKIK